MSQMEKPILNFEFQSTGDESMVMNFTRSRNQGNSPTLIFKGCVFIPGGTPVRAGRAPGLAE
jgi:hypothetical protein